MFIPFVNKRKIEPIDNIRALLENSQNSIDMQKEYAKKVAKNLYNFISSFENVQNE